jgi:hypothetical protein
MTWTSVPDDRNAASLLSPAEFVMLGGQSVVVSA